METFEYVLVNAFGLGLIGILLTDNAVSGVVKAAIAMAMAG